MTPTAEQPQGSSGLSGKNPIDSVTVMNELVLPNDTNVLNNLMGGRLLHWMDICAAITAQKHSSRTCYGQR